MTSNTNNKIYSGAFQHTLENIRHCSLCQSSLPLPARPVVQLHPHARILIIGQAPGLLAHNSHTPWNDPSGDRLRGWLNVSRSQFYDPTLFAIMPMGFCYPGKKNGGDAPPSPACAPAWHNRIWQLIEPDLTILVGSYAQKYYLPTYSTLTEAVNAHVGDESMFVLPHPSGRNNRWLKQNEAALNNQLSAIRNKLHTYLE